MKLFLEKIISGGQTGADQGGLEAGKILNIKTGGTAPRRFLTEKGPDIRLQNVYNLVEGSPDPSIYKKRTLRNILDSDGTAIFAKSTSEAGTKLTINLLKKHKKSYIINPTPFELLKWLCENKIKILNIAGNRESKAPGIQQSTCNNIILAVEAKSGYCEDVK